MQAHRNTDHRVLEVIVQSPGNALDDIVLEWFGSHMESGIHRDRSAQSRGGAHADAEGAESVCQFPLEPGTTGSRHHIHARALARRGTNSGTTHV